MSPILFPCPSICPFCGCLGKLARNDWDPGRACSLLSGAWADKIRNHCRTWHMSLESLSRDSPQPLLASYIIFFRFCAQMPTSMMWWKSHRRATLSQFRANLTNFRPTSTPSRGCSKNLTDHLNIPCSCRARCWIVYFRAGRYLNAISLWNTECVCGV